MKLTLHGLLALVPHLPFEGPLLLIVLLLILDFEDLLAEFLHTVGQRANFLLILILRFIALIDSLNFLFL